MNQGIQSDRYHLIPRVLIFLSRGGEVLLLKGASSKRLWANRYNGIGGHVEPGETMLQAAWRELAEETGLQPAHLASPGLWLCGVLSVDTGAQTGVGVFIFRGVLAAPNPAAPADGAPASLKHAPVPGAIALVPAAPAGGISAPFAPAPVDCISARFAPASTDGVSARFAPASADGVSAPFPEFGYAQPLDGSQPKTGDAQTAVSSPTEPAPALPAPALPAPPIATQPAAPSSEGALEWHPPDRLASLPCLPDLPSLLPPCLAHRPTAPPFFALSTPGADGSPEISFTIQP